MVPFPSRHIFFPNFPLEVGNRSVPCDCGCQFLACFCMQHIQSHCKTLLGVYTLVLVTFVLYPLFQTVAMYSKDDAQNSFFVPRLHVPKVLSRQILKSPSKRYYHVWHIFNLRALLLCSTCNIRSKTLRNQNQNLSLFKSDLSNMTNHWLVWLVRVSNRRTWNASMSKEW